MGVCDSKKKAVDRRRFDTFEDIDNRQPQKTGEPPPTLNAEQGDEIPTETKGSTETPGGSNCPTFEDNPSFTVLNKLLQLEPLVPSEKLSLIDQRDTLTAAVRETNFFQNEVDEEMINQLYSESTDGTFSTEALAKMLEHYVNICANFAKKEIRFQKEKLRKFRKDHDLDVPKYSFSPALDPGPFVNRQATGGMFGTGDRRGVNAEEADQIFSKEIENMRRELASDLAAIEAENDADLPELDTETHEIMVPQTSDYMPTSNGSLLEQRKSLGDANLQRKCGETIVTCNSFLSKLKTDPELMLAGVPRTFRKNSFTNFLPNFLESYAKDLGIFVVEEMAATRGSDTWHESVDPLQLGDVKISVFILSMTCLDVDLPWDPIDYEIAENQTIRQVNEYLFLELDGLEAYKEKFRTTLVQNGRVIDVPDWHSNIILTQGDELTINF